MWWGTSKWHRQIAPRRPGVKRGMMARFMKIRKGDREYVWDKEKDNLYEGDFETGIFSPAPNGMTIIHLNEFAPYAEDVGEVDEFPGKIVVGPNEEDVISA